MRRFVRLSSFLCWLIFTCIGGAIFLISSFFLYLNPDLPSIEQLKDVQLQTPLRIFTRDGQKIAEFGEKRRTPISIDAIPEDQLNAFLAAEDSRFYEHNGIDINGLGRAVTQLVATGEKRSGGSTITMQVARNFFFSREKDFTRKFKEIFLAFKIEKMLSKREIFELYLNKIFLGHRAYGIQAAANAYYGKNLAELDLAQMAMIAGLPKAPSRYNPITNPERAVIRRNWILDRMLELSMITQEAHERARSAPAAAKYHGGTPDIDAAYVAEMARQEVIAKYGPDAYTAGLKVFLTVDASLQKAASKALRSGIESYDRRHGYRGPLKILSEVQLLNRIELRQILAGLTTPIDQIAAAVMYSDESRAELLSAHNEIISLTLEDIKWAVPFISRDRIGKKPEKVDSVLSKGAVVLLRRETTDQDSHWTLSQIPEAQGAVVSINPLNGAILTLSGGYDFSLSSYNRANQAKRQPGSSFKPFIYLAALENGTTAATLINDAPIVFEDKNLETAWRPENSSGEFYGPTRLRQALYNSRNLVSIRLLQANGIDKTLNYIRKFGFQHEHFPRGLSLALGTAELTPLKLAGGYSMIANGGHYVEPYLIERIESNDGTVLYQAEPLTVCDDCRFDDTISTTQPPAIAPRIADARSVYILHSMLKDVITKGTGRKASELQRNDLAGKTGTTNDQKDAWFAGFNTRIATTAWVGFDDPESLGRYEYGARAALPIWKDYMAVALKGMPEASMKQPEGIVTALINSQTGELTEPGDPDAMFELFRAEDAPKPRYNNPSNGSGSPSTGATIQPQDIF